LISPERLRRFPHCAGASDEMLKQVAMLGKERNFKAGERLFEEGKPATHLLMLEAGEVDIVYTLAKARQVVVDTVVAGGGGGGAAAQAVPRKPGVRLHDDEAGGHDPARPADRHPGAAGGDELDLAMI